MNKYFKTGMIVWDIRKGEGIVLNVDLDQKEEFVVKVSFCDETVNYYTYDGKYSKFHKYPILFQNKPIVIDNIKIN